MERGNGNGEMKKGEWRDKEIGKKRGSERERECVCVSVCV